MEQIWKIELAVGDVASWQIEIIAVSVKKMSPQEIEVDGERWGLPKNKIGLSFCQLLDGDGVDRSEIAQNI